VTIAYIIKKLCHLSNHLFFSVTNSVYHAKCLLFRVEQIYCKGSNLSYTNVLLNSLGEGYLSTRSSLSSPSSPHLACPCHACPHPACPHRASPCHANPRCPRHASPRHPCLPILPPQHCCGRRVGVVVAVVTWHSSLCSLSTGPWPPTPRGHGRHVIAVVVGSLVVTLSSLPLVSGWRRRGRGGGGFFFFFFFFK
jgi:hypothetical protein